MNSYNLHNSEIIHSNTEKRINYSAALNNIIENADNTKGYDHYLNNLLNAINIDVNLLSKDSNKEFSFNFNCSSEQENSETILNAIDDFDIYIYQQSLEKIENTYLQQLLYLELFKLEGSDLKQMFSKEKANK